MAVDSNKCWRRYYGMSSLSVTGVWGKFRYRSHEGFPEWVMLWVDGQDLLGVSKQMEQSGELKVLWAWRVARWRKPVWWQQSARRGQWYGGWWQQATVRSWQEHAVCISAGHSRQAEDDLHPHSLTASAWFYFGYKIIAVTPGVLTLKKKVYPPSALCPMLVFPFVVVMCNSKPLRISNCLLFSSLLQTMNPLQYYLCPLSNWKALTVPALRRVL